MSENFKFLFQYLKKVNIPINESEFIFQIQSHPDYPSLLSIVDTLSFFKIDNGAIHVSFSELELLPDNFISLLKEKDGKARLYYLEKKGDDYFCFKNNKIEPISKASLESRWNNAVLLIEKLQTEMPESKSKIFLILSFLCLFLLVLMTFKLKEEIPIKLFSLFPILGCLFSIAALKDLFGTKSKILSDFCNINVSTSCSSIINSNKWKIFRVINFSDLSIIFFTSQCFTLFFFFFSGNTNDFFYIQKILLLSSIPIIITSLYYQKFVEKNWCPICLVVSITVVVELIYIFSIQNILNKVSYQSIIVSVFVYLFVSMFWLLVKRLLVKFNTLKEFQFEANRFIRNYENFSRNLKSQEKKEFAYSPIILGNMGSNLEITIITNPFCGFCKDVHQILEKIINRHKNNLRVKILMNVNIDSLDEEKKIFFRSLMSIYLNEGEHLFLEALDKWFDNKNLGKWLNNYRTIFDIEKIDSIYRLQNQWCISNSIYLTPSIFINGYKYPNAYKRESLEFFINELLEDNF